MYQSRPTSRIRIPAKLIPNLSTSKRTFLLCCFAVLVLAGSAFANAGEVTDETVLLSVHGNVEGLSDKPLELDLKTLISMDATSITTTAPWLDGPTEFKGVRISTLLHSIGANSAQFEAVASNDYRFTLSEIDFEKYPIIIAYEKNKELLNIRTQGPLLIMFPFDDFPELLTERNKAASVWQLIELHVL